MKGFGLFLHLILCTLFAFLKNLFSCLFFKIEVLFSLFPFPFGRYINLYSLFLFLQWLTFEFEFYCAYLIDSNSVLIDS